MADVTLDDDCFSKLLWSRSTLSVSSVHSVELDDDTELDCDLFCFRIVYGFDRDFLTEFSFFFSSPFFSLSFYFKIRDRFSIEKQNKKKTFDASLTFFFFVVFPNKHKSTWNSIYLCHCGYCLETKGNLIKQLTERFNCYFVVRLC